MRGGKWKGDHAKAGFAERAMPDERREIDCSKRAHDQSGRQGRSGRPPGRGETFWKRAFWTLASVNALALATVAALIMLPAGPDAGPGIASSDEHSPVPALTEARLAITGTAADLDGIVNRLLAGRQHERLTYRIEFGDPLRITGTLTVFGRGIGMEARFRPEVTPTGDLMLIADGMRIGRLPAPAGKILSYVRTYYELPDWISIEDGGERVRLRLTRMPFGNLELRALEMNAAADRYRFALTAKPAGGEPAAGPEASADAESGP
jgi:uncharacterized protein YpmS